MRKEICCFTVYSFPMDTQIAEKALWKRRKNHYFLRLKRDSCFSWRVYKSQDEFCLILAYTGGKINIPYQFLNS